MNEKNKEILIELAKILVNVLKCFTVNFRGNRKMKHFELSEIKESGFIGGVVGQVR